MSIFNVAYTITGDCSNTNSGSFNVSFETTAPDTVISWISPILSPTVLSGYAENYIVTGLSGGNYSFELVDSSLSANTHLVNIYISTGASCVSIYEITSTTCGLNNGQIKASTLSAYYQQTFWLYDINDNFIESGTTFGSDFTFTTELPPNVYYVIADDGAGCTGKSQSCVVKDSEALYFELFVVNNSSCTNNLGKLFVTNLLGVNPFQYTWSNGVTGETYITGLTNGSYSCTITDGLGCSLTVSATVDLDPPIGTGILTTIQPTCFNSDGQVTLTITGGTIPYYYMGSNGYSEISFLDTITFTGLSPGTFIITVTDAGFCTYNTSTLLQSVGAFSIVSTNIIQPTCNSLGTISTTVTNTGGVNITYELYNGLSQIINQSTSPATTYQVQNLEVDTYTLVISTSTCSLSNTFVLTAETPFTLTTFVTGTTCNLPNGSIEIQLTNISGVPPYTYKIISPTFVSSGPIAQTAHTFSNLNAATYNIEVIDSVGCLQTTQRTISPSSNINFILYPTVSIVPNSNSITALIYQGEPPFTWTWSPNVGAQTGLTVSNLGLGTYTLTIVDSNNCISTQSYTFNNVTTYNLGGTFTICNKNFTNTFLSKRGFLQMLISGFEQLTPNGNNCILSSATFTSEVIVSGVSYYDPFFTTTSFGVIPSDSAWGNSISNILEGIYGVGEVLIDYGSNTITVLTDCELPENLLATVPIQINLLISYDIACETTDQCCGIITEDFICIISEDDNGNEYLVIESDP